MDLIYTGTNGVDQGVLLRYELDLAFGPNENDFELTMDSSDHVLEPGSRIYMDGTEYGGIVDQIHVDTAKQTVTYQGRTWQGVLAKKILEPDPGQDYLICTGDANDILADLIRRIGLEELFSAPETASGIAITGYAMGRYADAYSGIRRMLETASAKLRIRYSDGRVILSAHPANTYADIEQLDGDWAELDIKAVYRPVNHMICLGRGDLAAREVIHLYADASGQISKTQSLFGLDEVTEIYDYSNAESLEELEQGGMERLQEAAADGSIKLQLNDTETEFEVGDIVSATDLLTGIRVTQKVIKKIIHIASGEMDIDYEVGG